MRLTTFIVLATVIAGGAHAQSGPLPAEFPPSSFKGTQYIDSKGCVFIRAGIDGNTTWVPRVNRQRSQICGQSPSLSPAAVAQARPEQAPEAPEQITLEAPAAPTERAAAAPAPQPAPVAVAPRPAPVVQAAPKPAAPAPRVVTRVKPAPKPVVAPVSKPAAKPVVVAPTAAPRAQAACRGGNAVSQRYINSGSRAPVRCGPQAVSPTGGATPQRVATRSSDVQTQAQARVSPDTRVLPRAAYDNRLQERGAEQVPEGFRPIWTDDRLNPQRGEQSLRGIAQSRLVWTNTVPRRLVDQTSGRDVTAKVALVYPYTDIATQTRDLGTVTLVRRNGQLIKRIQRNRTKARTETAAPKPQPAVRAKPAAVAKTKPAAKPQVAAKGQYVQVGTFGVAANAQNTAQRLARAGVPARIGTLKRGGKSYKVVLAGPYSSRSGLNSGLNAARSLGFTDAFIR